MPTCGPSARPSPSSFTLSCSDLELAEKSLSSPRQPLQRSTTLLSALSALDSSSPRLQMIPTRALALRATPRRNFIGNMLATRERLHCFLWHARSNRMQVRITSSRSRRLSRTLTHISSTNVRQGSISTTVSRLAAFRQSPGRSSTRSQPLFELETSFSLLRCSMAWSTSLTTRSVSALSSLSQDGVIKPTRRHVFTPCWQNFVRPRLLLPACTTLTFAQTK